jgi:predicted metal-binding membrane protein
MAPMALSFANLNRSRSKGARTLFFVAAYLALWTAFSGAATAAQWALQLANWVSPMIVSTSPILSGTLLLVAGCCWALMALLYVGGVMNILWIAALTVLVAIEKVAPKGEAIAKALGAVMIGAGVVRLALPAS